MDVKRVPGRRGWSTDIPIVVDSLMQSLKWVKHI